MQLSLFPEDVLPAPHPTIKRGSAKRPSLARSNSQEAPPLGDAVDQVATEVVPGKDEVVSLAQVREVATIKPVSTVQPPWPQMDEGAMSDLRGEVTKFEANVEAIRTLHAIELEQRQPTPQERIALQRYTGWGGLQKAISGHDGWEERAARLAALLSPEEYASARSSVLNAHYTEVPVVKAMWELVGKLGFSGGRVLDPSTGTGHFIGAMPSELLQKSEIHAVECDSLSGRIATALYGSAANLQIKGFESTVYPTGWFDLAITNVPFGDYGLVCSAGRPYSRWSIHNYFLGKCLDLVAPGGLVAIITSAFTMDAARSKQRAWIKTQAELLAAFRLPSCAFKRIAGTEVVADILVFRKRVPGEMPRADEVAFEEVTTLPREQTPDLQLVDYYRRANEYWVTHPEHVIGRWSSEFRPSPRLTVEAASEGWLEDLQSRVEAIQPRSAVAPASVETGTRAVLDEKDGQFVQVAGHLYQHEDGHLKSIGTTGKRVERVLGMLRIKEALVDLLALQMDPSAAEADVEVARGKLGKVYDAFVAKHGPVNDPANLRQIRSDQDWPRLAALEEYDPATGLAVKADIFSRRTARVGRTVPQVNNVADAMAVVLDECGAVDTLKIASLIGLDEQAVMKQLCEDGHAYPDPETKTWVSATQYLAGNVRRKLAIARNAGTAYQASAQALERVLPADICASEIEVRLGVSWVHPEEYVRFIKELAGYDAVKFATYLDVKFDPSTGSWAIVNRITANEMDLRWGTKDVTAMDLISDCMNGRNATVRDSLLVKGNWVYVVNAEKTAAAREKQDALNAEFKRWLWSEPERAKAVHRRYNDLHNCYVPERFDGSRLTLPGYSGLHDLGTVQLNVIARGATGKNLLLAHAVGAGKTLDMICMSMEMKRLGRRNKIVHAVPNHMRDQYAREFLRAYPNARLLVATKEDLKKENRRRFIARAAYGDWDAIVMTHSVFEKISADRAIVEYVTQEVIAEVQQALEDSKKCKEDRVLVKQMVKLEKQWTKKLADAQAEWRKDDFFSLGSMGVDHVIYDEAHLAKGLVRVSKMDRVRGLPNSDSKRAFDLYLKCQQMYVLHGHKEVGVVLATATPIANSMAEMHVFQRMLQPATLKEHGIQSFDSWAAQYGRVVTSLEVSPDGSTFRMGERFAQFCNMPELMSLFKQVADIQTKEMLNLPTPPMVGGAPQTIIVKPNDRLKQYIDGLVLRADRIRNRQVRPDEDNMLSITTDGRLAALDLRLVDPTAPYYPEGKIGACVRRVHELWLESESFKGAQLVFCDTGTPGSKTLDIYQEIKDRLQVLGVPAHEIAFIHDAKTDGEKEALFRRVRSGDCRVIIASTNKGGVGTNIQERLYAEHDLDVPWRPCDVEQRNGRIARRGNTCPHIYIIRYVAEATFDAYSWQTISSKQSFIAQVMCGEHTARTVEDVSLVALTYEEIKALACGNPAVKERAQLEAEQRKLLMLKSHHAKTAAAAMWERTTLIADRKRAVESLPMLANDQEVMASTGMTWSLPHASSHSTDVKGMLSDLLKRFLAGEDGEIKSTVVARYAGLPVSLVSVSRTLSDGKRMAIRYGRAFIQNAQIRPYASALLEEVESLAQGRERAPHRTRETIERLDREIVACEALMDAPFEKVGRLNEVEQRLKALDVELGLNRHEAGTEGLDEDSVLANKTSAAGESDDEVLESVED